MLINGEKWACEACVRGHRVSNCQHADRRLQHINKKGRPVSQCQHCRTMRKSRASHVKCNCGEKTHKCVHLQTTAEGHKDNCCCNHGGRCTCCHKKEHPQLDTVRESDPENDGTTPPLPTSFKKEPRIRKRSNTEGALSFDEFGHHMPVKHNKAAHNCGPYQLNRVNSLHSPSHGNRSADDLLHMTGNAGMDSHNGDSPASSDGLMQDGRMTRSEAASPLMPASTTMPQLGPLSSLTPLDLSIIHNPPFEPNSADFFGNISEYEQPMFSAGLSATSVDWSHYDGLDFGSARAADAPEFASSNFSQSQSYGGGGGFDFSGSEQLPTMTTNTSNSGDMSEVEDLLPNSLEDLKTVPHAAPAAFRDSTNSSNFDLNAAQMNMLGSANLSTLEYDKFKFLEAGTEASNYVPTYPPSVAGPLPAGGDDATFSRGALAGPGTFSVDPDRGYWMESFGPAHGLPDVTDLVSSADTEPVLGFWDTR